MNEMNWKRVMLGGTVTGLVLMAFASAIAPVYVGREQARVMADTFRFSPAGTAALVFIVGSFLFLGTLVTTSYAAMLPRFRPGFKTAALAGFSVWLTGICLGLIGFSLKELAMGEPYPLPAGPVLPCVCLAILMMSSMGGAMVYKENR